MEFRPERFLKDGKIDPGALDPEDVAFGFGRRLARPSALESKLIDPYSSICPGRHMSSVTIPLIFASILAFFDVQEAKDKAGHPIPVEYKVLSKLIAYVRIILLSDALLTLSSRVPLPYQCQLVPRSEKHVEFLRRL